MSNIPDLLNIFYKIFGMNEKIVSDDLTKNESELEISSALMLSSSMTKGLKSTNTAKTLTHTLSKQIAPDSYAPGSLTKVNSLLSEKNSIAKKSLFKSYLDTAKESRNNNNYEESLNNLYEARIALNKEVNSEIDKEKADLEIYEVMNAINIEVISLLSNEYHQNLKKPDYKFLLKISEKAINIIEPLLDNHYTLHLGHYYFYQGLAHILDHYNCEKALDIFTKHMHLFRPNILESAKESIDYCNNIIILNSKKAIKVLALHWEKTAHL